MSPEQLELIKQAEAIGLRLQEMPVTMKMPDESGHKNGEGRNVPNNYQRSRNMNEHHESTESKKQNPSEAASRLPAVKSEGSPVIHIHQAERTLVKIEEESFLMQLGKTAAKAAVASASGLVIYAGGSAIGRWLFGSKPEAMQQSTPSAE